MFGNQRAISSSRQLTTIGIAGILLAAILFIAPIQPGMQNAFAVNGDLDADVCESDLDGVWLVDTCTIDSTLDLGSDEFLQIPFAYTLVVLDSGNINNDGRIEIFGKLAIASGGNLENDGNIFINFSGILDNEGGSIENDPTGVIGNAGIFNNIGTIDNEGFIGMDLGGKLNNNQLGTITNTGTIKVNSQLNINDSELHINDGGILDLDFDGKVEINGGYLSLDNSGRIQVDGGVINLNSGGNIDVNDGSLYFINDGNLYVNELGTIYMNSGADAALDTGGYLSVYPGGSLNLYSGSILEIPAGTLNLFGGNINLDGGVINVDAGRLNEDNSRSRGRINTDGGRLDVDSGSVINVRGGVVSLENSIEVNVYPGGTINTDTRFFRGQVFAKSHAFLSIYGTMNVNNGDLIASSLDENADGGNVVARDGGVINASNGSLEAAYRGKLVADGGGTYNIYSGSRAIGFLGGSFYIGGTVNVFCGGTFDFSFDAFLAGTPTYIPCDADADGIADEVDTQPNTFSNDFKDIENLVVTTGTITSRGGQTLSIVDVASPKGVKITAEASGSGSPASVSVCGGIVTITFTAVTQYVLTCGSATTEVIQGPIQIDFFTADVLTLVASANIAAGNTITYDPVTKSFTAGPDNVSTTNVVLANGNTVPVDAGETIQLWDLKGFYSPVDMNAVVNTIKGGQSVPLKFEAFVGTLEKTAVSDIASFTQKKISCNEFTGDPTDAVEELNTLGTGLKYDTTAGQFIANWKTPKSPNTCWEVKVTTADMSSIVAFFKLT